MEKERRNLGKMIMKKKPRLIYKRIMEKKMMKKLKIKKIRDKK